MAKIIWIDEHFQHFLKDLKESFWGDLEQKTRLAWKQFFEADSERMRNQYMGCESYERGPRAAAGYRNGYYARDFVTRFGTIRLKIARTWGKSFLPAGLEKFQRRAPEVAMLIREAFLRGISTRQVGRVVATLTGEVVSAQTVSNLTRDLDGAVQASFIRRSSRDEWAYLFLDGVGVEGAPACGAAACPGCWWLTAFARMEPGNCLAFSHQGRGASSLGGAVERSLPTRTKGDKLLLIVTDGCPGLAAAIQTVYPRAAHQRCWVHKMRNILEKSVNATTMPSRSMHRLSIWPRAAARPRLRREPSAVVGEASIPPWSSIGVRSARIDGLLASPNICGASCAPPISSNAASSKSDAELGPWSASSMCSPWTASSTPSSTDSTWNGKTAPSGAIYTSGLTTPFSAHPSESAAQNAMLSDHPMTSLLHRSVWVALRVMIAGAFCLGIWSSWYFARADYLFQMDTEESLRSAIRLEPDGWEYYMRLAQFDRADARGLLETSLRLYPYDAQADIELG